ncbi:thiamine phosphate synthase [Marinomonas sp. C2222]|uniref:Thiamine-phosphate synthase n=1 Tax=Marinomonas sargassi TaxID=2984494 RepID=A0ABT2YRH0_9GAMM|nr:thiamine phosphate synthase [Marinomonas sargassi]MCV2402489.1 thiamine phosphate synthase [Marinomonas sargassi]
MKLSRFYPVFDSSQWIARLVPLGIKLVQLRIKDKPQSHIRAEILKAKEICEKHGCTLVINDYWRLAIELGCDWIHLGQEDLDSADMAQIKEANIKVGVSTHDLEELLRAYQLEPDYIALGPVYPTILKKMKWHQQGLGRVTEWKEKMADTPLVAIGGMSVERAEGAFAAGADIVAAVTDITLNKNPEQRIIEWLEACDITVNREFVQDFANQNAQQEESA